MSRDGGLADVHFEWPSQMRATLWRGLRWLMLALLPAVFVVTLAEYLPEEVYRNGVGRLAFVVASIALAGFAFTVLSPRSLTPPGSTATRRHRWVVPARYLASAVPLVFAGLAIWGYYYTAVRLEYRVFLSLLVVAAAVLVHSILSRWLVLVQRRLTRARVRAARESLSSGHRAGESGGSELLEVNLLASSERTQKLLGLAVAGLTVIGIWLTWREVIPALAILDDVTLWYRTTELEGVTSRLPITLGDLLAAMAIGGLTFVAGRSLPSLLELSMLPRLRLAPGTLYAISTLSQYTVITLGLIVALNMLGIGWGQVQWLVAAVGVGLGFGLREMFASLFAGLVILFERPIRVGDVVSVGDLTGTVSRIRIRATTVTDWDNRELVIPNYLLINEKLTNWTLNDPVTRLVVRVIVAFGSDVEGTRALMLDVARANPLVEGDPEPKVLFLGFGEHGLEFELWVFAKGIDERFALTDELHTELNRRLREQGIEVASPRLDVRVRPEEEARDMNRPSRGPRAAGP
jgi:potassium efflux system protein